MKRSKKGFTIVELVIVIAVIAILAAVLIPTFSGVINKAHKSADLQEARAKLSTLLADENFDGDLVNLAEDSTLLTTYGFTKSNGTLVYTGEYYTCTYTISTGKWTQAAKD